jgi:hypothetical protein
MMFPNDVLLAYLAAVLIVVIAQTERGGRGNIGAGLTFIAAGVSILALDRRR